MTIATALAAMIRSMVHPAGLPALSSERAMRSPAPPGDRRSPTRRIALTTGATSRSLAASSFLATVLEVGW